MANPSTLQLFNEGKRSAAMNPLQQLQLDIFGRLSGADYFSDISLFLIRPRSSASALQMQTAIDQVLAGLIMKNGKAGVACRVEMPYVDVDKEELPGPYIDVFATIQIIENPLINIGANGTQKAAEEIGINVLSQLHHWVPWGSGHIQRALFAGKQALTPVQSLIKEGKVAYDAILKTQQRIAPQDRVEIPSISLGGGNVTITTSTSGATIYYTVAGGDDAGFPWSGNPDATLYSAPFTTPSAGSQIRAVAYKTNFQASNVAALTT